MPLIEYQADRDADLAGRPAGRAVRDLSRARCHRQLPNRDDGRGAGGVRGLRHHGAGAGLRRLCGHRRQGQGGADLQPRAAGDRCQLHLQRQGQHALHQQLLQGPERPASRRGGGADDGGSEPSEPGRRARAQGRRRGRPRQAGAGQGQRSGRAFPRKRWRRAAPPSHRSRFRPKLAADLFAAAGKTPADVQTAIDSKPAPMSFARARIRAWNCTPWSPSGGRPIRTTWRRCWKAATRALKAETIVFSGHFDHDGIGPNGIFHGADDNGTGTVGVVELARAFAHESGEAASAPSCSSCSPPKSAACWGRTTTWRIRCGRSRPRARRSTST